jgi:hypothetical protein
MKIPTSVSPSFKLFALFLVFAGIPLSALGWLGWRLLDQDRAIASEQLRERRESAADLFIAGLSQAIASPNGS